MTRLEIFITKLKEGSKSDEFDEACKEWRWISKEEDPTKNNHCLCGETFNPPILLY